jgi:DNA-binding NtrC family response regulator
VPTIPEAGGKDNRELLRIKNQIDPGSRYIGESPQVLKLFQEIKAFNRSPDEPILLGGPTGSGKSVLAALIHEASSRKSRGFHEDCASDNMSMDFAITKGRWTGYGKGSGLHNIPAKGQPGLLQEYSGGTIFVDEIHHATLEFQVFLLNLLDGRPASVATGRSKPLIPRVRLIFATNEDLEKAAREGSFRHDLFARINARVLEVPPLADRKSDIPLFVASRCPNHRPSAKFLLCLFRYAWPGNVRQLLNALKLAKDYCGEETRLLTPEHLGNSFDRATIDSVNELSDSQAEAEVFGMLSMMLQKQGWEKGRGLQRQLARLTGMSEATVSRRVAQHHLCKAR